MKIRLAVAGLRHGHIRALLAHGKSNPNTEIVAVCEEDADTREQITKEGELEITHSSVDEMLASVECDAVAVGDYFAKRGSLLIKALEAGKHVISDKPICTSLDELDTIERLSGEKGLKVGCMFDIRDRAQAIGVRNLLQNDEIGEVHAITFGGEHPLMPGSRPSWYFEPGKHGGTINDIGCHAVDFIPWMTGLEFATVNCARCWNAFATDFPSFKDAGQMMLTMNNGGGVLGDVSYFMPDSQGYTNPLYWRMTFFGRKGILESFLNAKELTLILNGDKDVRHAPLPDPDPMGYLKAFVNDIDGAPKAGELSTPVVIKAARNTLTIQHAADHELTNVSL